MRTDRQRTIALQLVSQLRSKGSPLASLIQRRPQRETLTWALTVAEPFEHELLTAALDAWVRPTVPESGEGLDDDEWWETWLKTSPAGQQWMLICPPQLEAVTLRMEQLWLHNLTLAQQRPLFLKLLREFHDDLHIEWHRAARHLESSPRGRVLTAYLTERPRSVAGRRRGVDRSQRRSRRSGMIYADHPQPYTPIGGDR